MIKRVSVLMLALLLVASLAVPVAGNEAEGLSFTQELVWKGHKTVLETPATFEAWVKFPQDSSGRGGVILGTYGDNASESITFEVYSNGAPRLYWEEHDDRAYDWIFDNVNLYTGSWEHVAVVRDAQAGTVSCYLNGELRQSLPAGDSTGDLPLLPYCLGGDHRKDNAQYCKGQIRSVAVFSDVRTGDEIVADMTAPAAESLLLHYETDGSEKNAITDLSGNGYDLIESTRWFAEKEPVEDYAYSFMVIGDTQKVSYNDPNLFPYIYEYVVDNVEEKNVKFVMGLGDITEKSTIEEWTVAKESIGKLDGVVPYSVVRGNHDTIQDYIEAFPLSEYADVIAGSCGDNMLNTYQTFDVGKVKYLVLCLDYGASDAVLEWANTVVADHPDRNVIVTTHAYLYRDGTTLDKGDLYPPSSHGGFNDGDHMWDKLIRKHENIVLVLCGHDPNSQIVMTQAEGDCGNTVTQILIDGQTVDLAEGSSGFVTTFYFSEDGRDVTVEQYASLKQKFFLTENQFSFTLDLIEPVEDTGPAAEPVPAQDGKTEGPDVWVFVVIGVAAVAVAAVAAVLIVVKKKRK